MANDINGILAAANKVLMFPSTTLREACREYDVKISPATGLVVGGFIAQSPIMLGILWAVGKYKKNQRDKEEKERMKNEIIRKQQAIINKLRKENELISQEIKNLKDTLSMLEDVIKQMDRA